MRDFILWLIGERSSAGHGYAYEITGGWPWPAWLTVILGGLALLFLWAWYYRVVAELTKTQKLILITIRAAVVFLLIGMLGQWIVIPQRTTWPIVGIIIDDSMSMSVLDAHPPFTNSRSEVLAGKREECSRWEAAVAALTNGDAGLLARLSHEYRTKVYRLNDSVGLGEIQEEIIEQIKQLKPERGTTPLGGSLLVVMDQLRGLNPAAIITVTDGISNEGPILADAASEAKRRFIPLFFVAVGSETRRPDLAVENWIMEERVFLGDKVILRADIVTHHVKERQLHVRLIDEKDKSLLAEKTVDVREDGRSEVTLAFVPPRIGEVILRLECAPVDGELDRDNNQLTKSIWVEKRAIKVLLIGNTPGFEYRFLQNSLAREKSLVLESILLSADPEWAGAGQDWRQLIRGARDEVWSKDVIILADLPPNALPPRVWDDLAGFIDKNETPGGLIVIAGENFHWEEVAATSLARVLPIAAGASEGRMMFDFPAKVQPTEDGWRFPWLLLSASGEESRNIWRDIPGVYFCHSIQDLKPGARVLATVKTGAQDGGKEIPVFIFMYAGRGRVLFHATDETWRWRKVNNLMFYRQFWLELVRCMARAKLEADAGLVLSTDRKVYAPRDPVWITLEGPSSSMTAGAEEVTLWLERDGKQRRQIRLQRRAPERNSFQIVLHDLVPGHYTAWLAGERESIRTSFTVLPPKRELEQTDIAWSEMLEAAKQTGGNAFRVHQIDELVRALPAGKALPVEILPPIGLWNRPFVLALVIGLLAVEWALRRHWGLL